MSSAANIAQSGAHVSNAQPPSTRLTYTRRHGTSGLGGQMYEIKLAMLFLLQGGKLKQDGAIERFLLATNMQEAGAFDDVVFKTYKKDAQGNDTSTIVFVQSKHEETPKEQINFFATSLQKLDFNLRKYFDTYLDIKQQFIIAHDSFFTNVNDTEFNIFTNTLFAKDTQMYYDAKIVDVDSIWDFKPNNIFYQLNFAQSNDLDRIVNILNNSSSNGPVDKNEVKDFLSKFKIFTGQPNDNDLGKIINAKLQSMYNLHEDDVEIILDFAIKKVENWWKDKNDFLTEHHKIFEEAKQNLSKLKLVKFTENNIKEINDLGVTFKKFQLNRFRNYLRNAKILHVVTNEMTLILNKCKLYQVIRTMNEYKASNNEQRYMFVSSNELVNFHTVMIDTFKTSIDLIIIVCGETRTNIQEICKNLANILNHNNNKRIVLLAAQNDLLVRRFSLNCNFKKIFKCKISLNNLTPDSQNKLLARRVRFQGEIVEMNKLIQTDSSHLIKEEGLYLLMNNQEINIGTAPISLGEIRDVYIGRKFMPGKTIRAACFNERYQNRSWFAFSSIEEDELSILGGGQNIINFNNAVTIPEGDIKDRVVILAAEPGMGKSTVLTQLFQVIRTSDDSLWVIRLNLVDYCDALSNLDSSPTTDEAVEFLLEAAKLETDLEKNLFRLRLYKQHNVIIFLDAFDEISPHYKDRVLNLLDVLLKTSVKQLIITTRQHMTVALEDKLRVLPYNLQPLSKRDQIQFLEKYWGKKLNLQLEYDRSKQCIMELLDNFNRFAEYNIYKAEITGIPLLIRMFAETYENHFKIFYNSGKNDIDFSKNNNTFSLFQRVIANKFEIYCEDKSKDDDKNPAATNNRRKVEKSYFTEHRLFALDLLYSNEELNKLLSETERSDLQELKDAVVEANEQRGMVFQNISNKPIFIHRTFAEYFAADYLSINIENPNVKNVLLKKYFEYNFNVQRYFFDRFLTKDDKFAIQRAILNGENFMLKNGGPVDINNIDKAGRTALHLAVAQGDGDMTEILLDQKVHVNTRDMLGWTPLSYADRSNNWRLAEILLQSGACGSEMSVALSNIDQSYGHMEDTLLHIAAKRGYTKLVELLLDRGADLNLVNNGKRTALHEAVINNQFKVTKLLLEYNANTELCDFEYSRTALHYAAISNSIETVQCLVEHNAKVKARDSKMRTPLHHAAINKSNETVQYLVEHNAKIKARDYYNRAALHYAAINNSIETVQCLVEHNANIDARDSHNWTPLLHAADNDSIETVQYLVEHNANIEFYDYNLRTPLHVAVSKSIRTVQYLVDHNAEIEFPGKYDRTPLHIAVINNSIKTVRVLVEHNANIEARDLFNKTPLFYAAENNHLEIVHYLVDHNAEFEFPGKYDRTPLHIAVINNSIKTVRVLVEHNANIEARDLYNRTPLFYAAKNNYIQIVQYLVQHNAEIGSR